MNKLTIGLLLCDSVQPELRSIAGDYPDMFADLFRDHSPPDTQITLRNYDVTIGHYPDRLDECDGYLTNGAAASVNDDDPWIRALEAFVRTLHQENAKLFAICFGHQMIARALGGRVAAPSQGWGVGVHEVTITKTEPWMKPPVQSFHIISTHQDQVTELPPGAEILASTPHCPVSMLHCGSLIGIQGHPEFQAPYAKALMDSRAETIPAETRAGATESYALPPDHAILVSWMVAYLSS